MKILIGILLVLHGLIVAGQSAGSFGATLPNEIQNPAFVSWWPVNMGRSWLFSWLGLEKALPVYRISGLLWLVGGIVLVAAGLGLLGLIIPSAWWRDLALAGGVISLFMLVMYLHPLMILERPPASPLSFLYSGRSGRQVACCPDMAERSKSAVS